MTKVILETKLAGLGVRRGKVRDMYDLGQGILMMVATDRISAFDHVLPNGIPGKGTALTRISTFWLESLASQYPNHFQHCDITNIATAVLSARRQALSDDEREQIDGRSMLVKKTRVIPVECVVRGYLAGSGWQEYQQNQHICGIKLPPGMQQCDELQEPIFTPATKADAGHDENISFEQMILRVHKFLQAVHSDGHWSADALCQEISSQSLNLYQAGADYAREKGIFVADTKFEWGLDEHHEPTLIDEVLTPDSSRFWPADQYQPGRPQPSMDKQIVRDWLENEARWDKNSSPPELPPDIVQQTSDAYQKIVRLLTS